MPETPDFETIAWRLIARVSSETFAVSHVPENVDAELLQEFVEQLRLVWNARGAADIAQLEHDLSTMMGTTAAGPYVKNLDRALRTLDR